MNRIKEKIISIISLITVMMSSVLLFSFARGETAVMDLRNGSISIGDHGSYCVDGDTVCYAGTNYTVAADIVFKNNGAIINGDESNPVPYSSSEAMAAFAWVAMQPYQPTACYVENGHIMLNCFPPDAQIVCWNWAEGLGNVLASRGVSVHTGAWTTGHVYPMDGEKYRQKIDGEIKNGTTLGQTLSDLMGNAGTEVLFKAADGSDTPKLEDADGKIKIGPLKLQASEVTALDVTNEGGAPIGVEYIVYEGTSEKAVSFNDVKDGREFYIKIDKATQKDNLNTKTIKMKASVKGGYFKEGAWPSLHVWTANGTVSQTQITVDPGEPNSTEPQPLELSVPYEQGLGELVIHKYHLDATGAQMSVDLPGAEFTIKNSEGKYVKADNQKEEGKELVYELTTGSEFTDTETRFKTGEDSGDETRPPEQQDTGRSIRIKNLPVGTYTIEEVKAPRTFELSTNGDGGTSKQTAEIKEGDTAELQRNFYNAKLSKGKLTIGKYEEDENGNAKVDVGLLGGAKFSIKNSDGIYLNNTNFADSTLKYTDENISDKCTTAPTKENPQDNHLFETTEGKELVFEDLPFGEYVIEEVIAPDGYELSTNGDNGGNTQTANIQSGGAIELTRNFHNKKTPEGPGIEIEKIEKGSTDGKILPGAKFSIYENMMTIPENGTKGSRGYIKHTGNTENPYKPGEAYEVKYDEDFDTSKGNVTEQDEDYLFSSGEGEEGNIIKITGLRPGIYTITEVVAPTGYKLPEGEEATKTVEIKEADTAAAKLTFEDEKAGDRLLIKKLDRATGELITGHPEAEFTIKNRDTGKYLDAEGNEVEAKSDEEAPKVKLGEDGMIEIEGVPEGYYIVTEIVPPDGYKVEPGYHGEIAVPPGELTMFNDKEANQFTIKKVDKYGNPLAGATFTVQNEKGEYLQEDGTFASNPATQFTTDGNGTIVKELPAGTYTVTEVAAPEGFKADTTPKTVTVPDEKEITVQNETDINIPTPPEFPDGTFRKIIEGTDKGLEGFQFEFEEHTIEEEYPEIPAFTGAGESDFYSGTNGHCEFNRCEKVDEPQVVGYDAMGNPIYKCSLHGKDVSHCAEWMAARDQFNQLVDQANTYHQAREDAIKQLNAGPLTTDAEGYGDISPLGSLADDNKGIIDVTETSVGSNPYFNLKKDDGSERKWEHIDYHGDTVLENERKRVDLEGLIWEDSAALTKDGRNEADRNNLWDEGEPDELAHPVEIRLYTSSGEEIGKGVLTEDGHYRIRVGGKDGKDLEKLNQDPYIEFTYNGMKYQCVPQALIDQDNGSKALETINDRNNFNDRYDVITSNGASGDVNTTLADSDGTVIRYNKEEEYVRKITYEGSVTGGFTRDEKGSETTGDAKYTVEKMPGANEDPETDQQGENKRDTGFADNCHYITGKEAGDKYQIKATTKEAKFSIAQKYQDEIVSKGEDTIKNINLGIYRREQPDISIVNDVYKSMVASNGGSEQDGLSQQRRERWYTYGQKTVGESEKQTQYTDQTLGVKFGKNNGEGYKREVSPSEEKASDITEFKVYVVYKTVIRNESTNLIMQPTEIISNYDKDYVRIENVGEDGTAGSVKYQVDWSQGQTHMNQAASTHNAEDRTENYKSAYGKIDTPIPAGESITIYTLYEFGRDQAWALYDNNEVPFFNHVEVNAYTTSKTGQSAQNGTLNDTYAGVDIDSACGNSTPGDNGVPNDTYEDDNDDAPVFKLVKKDNRVIKGKVFLDQISQNDGIGGEYKGNGINENETPVENVQVELIQLRDDGTEDLWQEGEGVQTAYGYQPDEVTPNMDGERLAGTTKVEIDEHPNDTNQTSQALKITGPEGEYTFSGVIPGRYIIKYTWGCYTGGDGQEHRTKYIRDNNGAQEEVYLYPEQYKSTVFDNEARYTTYVNGNGDPSTPMRWLLPEFDQGETKYSSKSNAVDDMQERYAIDNGMLEVDGTDNYVDVHEKNTSIHSRTPAFEIGVEATVQDEEGNTASEGTPQQLLKAEGVDFGISERPTMDMAIEKQIDRVRITLANGQVLVDATVDRSNPDDPKLNGSFLNTVYMSPEANSIGNFKTEMDQEIMQGATMEITYRYIVSNNSNVDYVITNENPDVDEYKFNAYQLVTNVGNNKYYKFGVTPTEEQVEMKPTLIVDYLDNKMNYLRRNVDGADLNPPVENDYWERLTYDEQNNEQERITNALFDPTSKTRHLYDEQRFYTYEELIGLDKPADRMSAINTNYWTLLRDQSGNGDGINGSTPEISLKAGEKDTDSVKLIASKVLSDTNDDEDLDYYNTAEIIRINRTGGEEPEPIIPGNSMPLESIEDEGKTKYQPTTNPAKEGDSSTAEHMSITPPTGDIEYNYQKGIWALVAVASLGILGAGTVAIKRTMLTTKNKKNKK